ncbi:MAG: hypothetical protein L6Q55_15695 [Azonexus sp.]|nr:hypothetical protein [Azonexus sp.]MCK6413847.1 hypothetical protein [Azonexus sp.]
MALPAVIQDIIRLIGHSKTMALVEVIGERATRKLAAEYGTGEPLYIALCDNAMREDRNRKMIARYEALLAEKHSGRGAVSILVREFGPSSYRSVEKIVNAPLPVPSMTRVFALEYHNG